MVTLDELIRSKPDELSHPRLRAWKKRLESAGKATLEVHQPPTALGLAQAEIVLHFTKNGQAEPDEIVAWDDELNAGLIELCVRAINLDNEAARFALALRGALRNAEREFGDGYLNSVLVDLMKDSDLTQYAEIAEILKHSTALGLDSQGKTTRSYNLCREMIAGAISARANELRTNLGYTEEEIRQIIVRALRQYLDERFSVSARRQLGLL